MSGSSLQKLERELREEARAKRRATQRAVKAAETAAEEAETRKRVADLEAKYGAGEPRTALSAHEIEMARRAALAAESRRVYGWGNK